MTSKELFDKIRNYCEGPWVSTRERLPEVGQLVLLASYTTLRPTKGELSRNNNPGYFINIGYLIECTPDTHFLTYAQIKNPCSNQISYDDDNTIEDDGKRYSWLVYNTGGGYSRNYVGLDGYAPNDKSPDNKFVDPATFKKPEDYVYAGVGRRTEEAGSPEFWMPIPQIR